MKSERDKTKSVRPLPSASFSHSDKAESHYEVKNGVHLLMNNKKLRNSYRSASQEEGDFKINVRKVRVLLIGGSNIHDFSGGYWVYPGSEVAPSFKPLILIWAGFTLHQTGSLWHCPVGILLCYYITLGGRILGEQKVDKVYFMAGTWFALFQLASCSVAAQSPDDCLAG
jgi:hypothetical protein